jgi:uncharacterized membrane protein
VSVDVSRTPGPAWIRVVVAATAGVVAAAVTAIAWRVAVAPSLGWTVAAGIYVLWNLLLLGPMDAGQTAAHATREDPSRRVAHLLVLLASVASLLAVGVLLARGASGGTAQDVTDALAVCCVAASWLLVHTVFMLRYARMYYGDPVGGIDFNQHEPPRYLDFAYLAFTLGMTYQVSDTDLQTTELRATALAHSLLSFLFGAVVLATTVNLVAGLAG